MTDFDLQHFLSHLVSDPGVYRFYNRHDELLYVGKAKNLKRRVLSYFQREPVDTKTRALVKLIDRVEITITASEREALLLENTLIKKHRPRYNIVFRDDKSYPYLLLSTDPYPRISAHRGAKKTKGEYFGPYPNMSSVRTMLYQLQKLFPIRQCSNQFFSHRSRPCLQHQIKRCSAPCVNLISTTDYNEDVENVRLFLQGKNKIILKVLADRMERAAEALNYERAAQLRDQLKIMRQLQEQQSMFVANLASADIIAIAGEGTFYCIHLLTVRSGQVMGSQNFFPHLGEIFSPEEVLKSFVNHYYSLGAGSQAIPEEIILSHPIDIDPALLTYLKTETKKSTQIKTQTRGPRAQWQRLASTNASKALATHISGRAQVQQRLCALQMALKLDQPPLTIECFDISHTFGNQTVAACVVYDHTGHANTQYRRFNIEGITDGDDYAALKQALLRRYKRLINESKPIPDIIIIDGGKGQLKQGIEVLAELQINDSVLLSISKGPGRNANYDQIWQAGVKGPLPIDTDSEAMHLIQAIRDEAHRFAITGHRKRRAKSVTSSPLDDIPGIGAKRKSALLKHFGGWREITAASIDEIAKVDGISKNIADLIYARLHP